MTKQDLIWFRDNISESDDEELRRALRWAINRIEKLERDIRYVDRVFQKLKAINDDTKAKLRHYQN